MRLFEEDEETVTEEGAVGATFDFDAHKRVAQEAYQRVRHLYAAFSSVVEEILLQALRTANIKVASVEARAKAVESFAMKAAEPLDNDSNRPKYTNPLEQITDLAAARVITFFLDTLPQIQAIIESEFQVMEKADKADILMKEERLGYRSIHYVVALKSNRTTLPEYSRYVGLRAELQLRTVLQHAWAEIEHDIQYKSVTTIPLPIRRRFMALAGLLEIADREFQEVQAEDERLRQVARQSVKTGKLENVEITGDALKAYLDQAFGPDGRMKADSYEYTAATLRRLGFSDFREIDQCIAAYNDDALSRTLWGNRQGQLTRFEDTLLAAMGTTFIERHQFGREPWFRTGREKTLTHMRARGVRIGTFVPGSMTGPEVEAPRAGMPLPTGN